MLERLIEITNSESFLEEGHIAIKEVIATLQPFDLKLIVPAPYKLDSFLKVV